MKEIWRRSLKFIKNGNINNLDYIKNNKSLITKSLYNNISFKLFALTFLLISGFTDNTLYSQNRIELNDTLIQRAVVTNIPVFGQISESNGNIEICIKFNAFVIDVKDIKTDENCIISGNLTYTLDMMDLKNSTIIIKADNFQKDLYGKLFWINIEGLAGIDTSTYLEPYCLKINNQDATDPNFTKALVTVQSSPVEPKFNERLGLNSPNPFTYETNFDFSIDMETFVEFKIFSLSGRKVLGNEDFQDAFEFSIKDSNNNLIENPAKYLFKRGNYKLNLKALPWKLSSGAYYLIMKTSSNTFKTNFMLIK